MELSAAVPIVIAPCFPFSNSTPNISFLLGRVFLTPYVRRDLCTYAVRDQSYVSDEPLWKKKVKRQTLYDARQPPTRAAASICIHKRKESLVGNRLPLDRLDSHVFSARIFRTFHGRIVQPIVQHYNNLT